MIKTAVKKVRVMPVNDEHWVCGPAVEVDQHIVYHVHESPGKATEVLGMIDSGVRMRVNADSTVTALRIVSAELDLSVDYPVQTPETFKAEGWYTTTSPMVLLPREDED